MLCHEIIVGTRQPLPPTPKTFYVSRRESKGTIPGVLKLQPKGHIIVFVSPPPFSKLKIKICAVCIGICS